MHRKLLHWSTSRRAWLAILLVLVASNVAVTAYEVITRPAATTRQAQPVRSAAGGVSPAAPGGTGGRGAGSLLVPDTANNPPRLLSRIITGSVVTPYAFRITGTLLPIQRINQIVTLTLRITCRATGVRHAFVALIGLEHWVRLGQSSSGDKLSAMAGLSGGWDLGSLHHGQTITFSVRLLAKDEGNHTLGVLVSHQFAALSDFTGRAVSTDTGGYAQFVVAIVPARGVRG